MAKRKKIQKGRNLLKSIYLAFLIIAILFLLFNDQGVIKYFKLKAEIKELDEEIEKSRNEIKRLTLEIDSLKHSNKKIEKIAREKYHMKRPNEEEFLIEKK